MTWTLHQDGAVAELAFANPPHHVLDHAGVNELERQLAELAERSTRVVILTGADPDIFIAHADLGDLAAMALRQATSGDPAAWPRVLRLLDRGPFVTIAAINGQAWGGGLEIALTCGLRVAAQTATFCFPEIALGIVPAVAAHRLLAAVPETVALDLLLLAEPFSALEAHRLGLITRIVPAGEARSVAHAMADRILSFTPGAVDAVRALVVDGRDANERTRRQHQQELFGQRLSDPATADLIDAALERSRAAGTPSDPFNLTRRTP